MDSPLDGKHVLVSGSKGFMGKRLCHALEEKAQKLSPLIFKTVLTSGIGVKWEKLLNPLT